MMQSSLSLKSIYLFVRYSTDEVWPFIKVVSFETINSLHFQNNMGTKGTKSDAHNAEVHVRIREVGIFGMKCNIFGTNRSSSP